MSERKRARKKIEKYLLILSFHKMYVFVKAISKLKIVKPPKNDFHMTEYFLPFYFSGWFKIKNILNRLIYIFINLFTSVESKRK